MKKTILIIFLLISNYSFGQIEKAPERFRGEGPFNQLIIRGVTLINGNGSPPRGPVDVVVEDDRIVSIRNVGYPGVEIDQRRRPKLKPNGREIDATEMYLLPGFIDSHTHVCHYGNRSDEHAKRNSGISYQQILEEGGGIHNTMNSTSNSTDEQLTDDTLNRLKRHFQEGVLTCEVKSGYAPNLEDEVRMLRIINEIDSSNAVSYTHLTLPTKRIV